MENEITTLREQVEFWQKEAAGRREDMANYTRIVSETIDRLNVEVEKLKAELTSIDGALNDPRANLTLTTSEIIWELKEQVEKLTKERDEYKSGFEAAASKYRNLKLQMQEIINVC